MAKQNVLIVDADQKSLRVLEVSLKKAGYSVTKAINGKDALEKMEFSEPDLIISDTAMPELDGFALCTILKQNEKWSSIPFIFLTAQKSIEDKIRGLELGVDDYLNKPIFIREILARVNLAIQRRQRERLERRGSKTSFSGELMDMGILDLLQTIDISRKTGVIHIHRDDDEGQIYFRDGKVVNASTRNRMSADAVYRMLVWNHGHFEIEFKGIEGEETIELSTQGLLMEGMRRLDEWGRLQEQLPSLESVFDVDVSVIAERLGEIPDEINGILKHFDGKHTLMEVVDLGELGDLEALTVITKLYFEGLITEVATEMIGQHSVAPGSEQPEPPTHSSEPGDVVDGQGSLLPAPDSSEAPDAPSSKMYETLRMGRADEDLPPGSPAPRLSIAVRGLGFVESLTRDGAGARTVSTQPPQPLSMAPRSWEAVDPRLGRQGLDPSRLSDPGPSPLPGFVPGSTLEFVRDQEGSVSTREERDERAVPSNSATNPQETEPQREPERETRSLVPQTAAAVVAHAGFASIEQTLPPQPVVDLSHSAMLQDHAAGVLPEEKDSAARIAAALDAQAPAPTDPEPPTDRLSGEYFDGESFAKVARGRATPPGPIRLGIPTSSNSPGDPAMRDSWDPAPVAMHQTRRWLIVTLVVVALAGVAWGVWQWRRSSTGAAFDDLPIVNPLAISTDQPLNTEPIPEPSTTSVGHAPTSSLSTSSPETAAAESSGQASAATEPEETTATVEPAGLPGTGSAPVASIGSEGRVAYDELLAKAEKGGRKQQLTLLREAMVAYPSGDEAPAQLAILLMESTRTRTEALILAQQAVGLNPGNAMAWLAIGYIHQLKGEKDEAQAAYERCAAAEGPKLHVGECKKLIR